MRNEEYLNGRLDWNGCVSDLKEHEHCWIRKERKKKRWRHSTDCKARKLGKKSWGPESWIHRERKSSPSGSAILSYIWTRTPSSSDPICCQRLACCCSCTRRSPTWKGTWIGPLRTWPTCKQPQATCTAEMWQTRLQPCERERHTHTKKYICIYANHQWKKNKNKKTKENPEAKTKNPDGKKWFWLD